VTGNAISVPVRLRQAPFDGLKVTIRKHAGDWTKDHEAKSLTDGKTDKNGTARFTLADGDYVEITSDKELPYLNIPVGYKDYPGSYDRLIKVGKEAGFAFNLADACKLIPHR
jgi:hypothetical protein